MAYTLHHQTPSAGYISWASVHIVYNGVDHTITDGNTNLMYVWWDATSPTVLQTSATYPSLSQEDALVFINRSGVGISVLDSSVTDGGLIVPGTITAEAIAAGAIVTDTLAAGAITTDKIDANAVTTGKIAAGAVTADQISAGAITTSKLAASSITANEIAAGAVITAKIAAGAVTTNEIAANTITAANIAAGTITATQIAAGTITGAEIAAGTIQASNIAANTITASQIAANAITSSELSANSVIAGKIAAGAVGADQITANAITTDKIAANSVSASKLSVTDPTNFVENWNFELGDTGWTNFSGGWSISNELGYAGSSWVMKRVATTTSTSRVDNTWEISVQEGDSIFIRGKIKSTLDAGAGAKAIGVVTNSGTASYVALTTDTPEDWLDVSGFYTVPAGITTLKVCCRTVNQVAGSTVWFDNIEMRRGSAVLIEDGMITATKMAANSITAANGAIADLAVTNAKIANVDAAKITTGYLSADRIEASSITSDKISVTSLSALSANLGTITSGTVTGATIRTAASGARVQLTSTNGIEVFNATTRTAHLNKDGSGYLGLTNPISWNSAGVVTVPGTLISGEIVGNTIKTATSGWRVELQNSGYPIRVWDGTNTVFSVSDAGAVAMNATLTAGGITLNGGTIKSGQTAFDTGTGFWLGDDAGTPKFSIGNSAGDKLTWDGSNIGIQSDQFILNNGNAVFKGIAIIYNSDIDPTNVTIIGGEVKSTSLSKRTGLNDSDIETTSTKRQTTYEWTDNIWKETIVLSSEGYAVLDGIMVGRGQGRYDTNTVLGIGALEGNVIGAVGEDASHNTAIGYNSLKSNTTGGNNTAIGIYTLDANTSGHFNTAVGFAALSTTITGWYNVAVGTASLGYSKGHNNIGIGHNAGTDTSPFYVTTQNNRIVLGDNNITNAYIKVSWTVTSDERDKANIEPIDHGLNFICDIEPIKFVWDDRSRYWETLEDGTVIKHDRDGSKKSDQLYFGFSAQQVKSVEERHGVPENVIVNVEQEDKWLLKETALIPVIVNAIKELKQEIDQLKRK